MAQVKSAKSKSNTKPVFNRAVLKLSGEVLLGNTKHDNFSTERISHIVGEIKSVWKLNVQLLLVLGGGNILRGSAFAERIGINRVQSDYMGMLATVINSMALQGALQSAGIECRLQSAVAMDQIAQIYIRQKAVSALRKNIVVLLAGGSGNPFFTTDTAASLRAAEIGADILLKGTKVQGVYSGDPKKNLDSKLLKHINYDYVLTKRLGVMDATALTMCRSQNIPIHVFDIFTKGNLKKILLGKKVGTRIDDQI